MTERLRPAVAPAYLFLCLLLGGSAQGYWGNALLRLLAILIIAWALIERHDEPLWRPIRQLLWLVAAAITLSALQLLPLPFSMWAALPGHQQLANGFELLGIAPTALPLSLSPYDGIAALLALFPPLGMIAAMAGLRGYSNGWLAAALVAGTVCGVLLGILQAASPDPLQSPWYPYQLSNFGVATGFFANGNHMASLLLVTIPFLAALAVAVRENSSDVKKSSAALALIAGGAVVTVLGLTLNGSLAGYGLGLPVILASLFILLRARTRLLRVGAAAIGIGTLVALAMLWSSPVSRGLEAGASGSVESRQTMAANSFELVRQYAPLGSGLGTFERVYRLNENPDAVDRYYVNHAHNDYLELAVETGLPGVVLILLFLSWWSRSVWRMLRSPAADSFAFAGAIGSAALLLHSAVDYPLRTAAMSTVLAMCLVLIIQSRRSARSDSDLRPTRHLVLG